MKLMRFTKTERLFHWSFAVPVVLLAFTGIAMPLSGLFDGMEKPVILKFHTGLGCLLVILPLLILLKGDRETIMRNVREVLHISDMDRRWLAVTLLRPFKRDAELPEQGKFNGGQKINTLIMMFLVTTLSMSGFSMLLIKGSLISFVIHVTLSLALVVLLAGHLFMALINPSTRHSLGAVLTGRVHADWMKEHHGAMYRELAGDICGDIVFEAAVGRKDLLAIYRKVYSHMMTFRGFKRLAGASDAVYVARRGDRLIGVCRIVGDGMMKSFIAEYHEDMHIECRDLFDRMMKAVSAKIGRSVCVAPKLKCPVILYDRTSPAEDNERYPVAVTLSAAPLKGKSS